MSAKDKVAVVIASLTIAACTSVSVALLVRGIASFEAERVDTADDEARARRFIGERPATIHCRPGGVCDVMPEHPSSPFSLYCGVEPCLLNQAVK